MKCTCLLQINWAIELCVSYFVFCILYFVFCILYHIICFCCIFILYFESWWLHWCRCLLQINWVLISLCATSKLIKYIKNTNLNKKRRRRKIQNLKVLINLSPSLHQINTKRPSKGKQLQELKRNNKTTKALNYFRSFITPLSLTMFR